MVLTLWLYALSKGIGSAREIARRASSPRVVDDAADWRALLEALSDGEFDRWGAGLGAEQVPPGGNLR